MTKTLGIMVCASLMYMALLGAAHQAYAQDADQNAGAWNAANDTTSQSDSPESRNPPLNIQGSWCGSVTDNPDGTGSATFQFSQNGSAIQSGSGFDFEWPDSSFAFGPIKGKVSSNGFKFKGNAGKGCTISGKATGNSSQLTGTFHFHKQCGKYFKSGPFTITPC